MAYAGPRAPRPTSRVAAYPRRRPLDRWVVPMIGGFIALLAALVLSISFATRPAPPAQPTPAGEQSGDQEAPHSVAGAASSTGARTAQQGGSGNSFAAPPPELSSDGWIQNFRPSYLWSSAGPEAAILGELPQWTYLQGGAEVQGSRIRVVEPGDGARRGPRAGWIDAGDVGPAGVPAFEWYLGVAGSEQGLAGAPMRISEDWPAPISAQGAVIMDAQTGAVLFGKNARRRIAMASLTKMLTAIIAIERGRLDDRVTVDVDGLKMAIEMESTVMGLKPGDGLRLETLLYGLMLPSGNDAAVAIAKHIAGSEAQFVELMNAKVREMGLVDTQFRNPHGLDASGHYSTPFDQATIARYGMNHPTFAKLAAAREFSGDGYQLWNTNRLLWNYPGADGVKPGFTDDAGSALVASATRDGHRVITAVIKANSAAVDSVPLLDWAFRSFRWQ